MVFHIAIFLASLEQSISCNEKIIVEWGNDKRESHINSFILCWCSFQRLHRWKAIGVIELQVLPDLCGLCSALTNQSILANIHVRIV